ncbi:MAG TPA: hypothetical protein VMU84_20970, partial [Thermoanaerobaculia bacterium]|nr:hypothetical protein [Thermoanaerobaculia bacterium]
MVLATLVLAAVLPLDAKPDAVGDALRARDSLSRTTAARIAAVRDLKSLAPALREALAKESDANVAREEIRALVLLGGDEDVAVAADATKRFPAPIDEAFSNAVARLGAPRAIDLYFAHVASMREIDGFFELALWRRPDLVTSTASRLIGAKDERGFVNLTVALNEAKLAINADIIAIALQSELPKIREAAVWHVVENFVDDPSRIAKSVRDVVPYSGAMEIREAFGRELLKRMLGGEPAKIEGSLAWLEKYRSWGTAMLALMSTEEREATRSPLPEAPKGKTPSAPVRRPSFTLPAELPAGLADAV